MIRVGRVVESKDPLAAGCIRVIPLDAQGTTADFVCAPCTPNLGGGTGFLSVPGPGTAVLFVHLKDFSYTLAGGDDHSYNYVWLGALGEQIVSEKGRHPHGADKNAAENWDTSQRTSQQGIVLDTGIPEPDRVYGSNFYPEVDIWKHRNGHKILLAHKVALDGVNDDCILVQARSGKKIHIDDQAPVSTGGGDRITICDEKADSTRNANRIELITSSDKLEIETFRDQEYISNKGHQNHTILHQSSGHQRRDNMGSGDILDTVHQGNYQVIAKKNVTDIAEEEDILYQAKKGDITITADQGSILENAMTEIKIQVMGTTITVTPTSVSVDAPVDINLTAPSITLNSALTTTINSPTFTVNSPVMSFNGVASLSPTPLGTSVLNTHTHLTTLPLIPTSPPIT